MRSIDGRIGRLLLALFIGCVVSISAQENAARPATSEIEQLKQMLADQQRQINELRQALAQQAAIIPRGTFPSTGEVASTTPMVPSGSVVVPLVAALSALPQAAAAATGGPTIADVSKRVDGLMRNLGGFRFSGDFRYRFDLQDRSSNSVAGPLQNARSRYRARFNADKDLFSKDGDERPLAHVHLQLSTAPYNNPLTNDTDFTALGYEAAHPALQARNWPDAPVSGFVELV